MCLCPKTVGGVPLVFFTCVWYEIIVQTEVCCYNNTCSDVWPCFSNEEAARPLEMRNVMAPRNSVVLNLLPPGYQNKNAWKLHLKKTVNILYHCTWKMISDENWAQSLGQQFPLNFNRLFKFTCFHFRNWSVLTCVANCLDSTEQVVKLNCPGKSSME